MKPHYTKGVIMIVSNPVDVLVYQCTKWMGLPNGMVFGTGCILDSSRFTRLIADYTRLNTEVVKATIAIIDKLIGMGFIRESVKSLFSVCETPEEVLNAVEWLTSQ